MNTARPRLVVVQVLVMALFVTLFARLWYLQIASGEAYQAQAVDNAIEDVVVQPPRGLIVDAMGRPLAASRMSWVVTVDRTDLAEMKAVRRRALLHRLADVVDLPYRAVVVRTKLCGDPGAPPPPRCWNGSPYSSVPVAEDISQSVAISIQERGEDFPGVTAERQSVRSYPHPFGVNAAHLLGYLTPITADEYEHAKAEHDPSLNAASLVGRSGLERAYDRYLRGVPGSTGVAVDSMGRAVGAGGAIAATPGQTLVTSIDARVQSIVESELRNAIHTARNTVDTVTGRPYEASSGAAVVLDPRTGRVIASASYPTYDPDVWVGGISDDDLQHLYAKKAGEPLLSRPTQAQLPPGSTWKPFMASGALSNGFRRDAQLNCSPSFMVGNRAFTNFESGSHGYIGFDQALQLSCNTFFYQVGYALWQRAGGEEKGARADAVLADMAKAFGFGKPTGIDLPAEAGGRIADPRWKLAYWRSTKDYYCKVAKEPGSDYLHIFAREFCVAGYRFGAGDAVNFVIGQGDTVVTPLQLAVGYSALANGGIVYAPRVAKAVVGPDGTLVRRIPPERVGRLPMSRKDLRYIDTALLGTAKVGTMAWKMGEFPLDQVRIRSKTGTAEVYGKQTTSWVATYDRNYVVVMMVEQGGTGSGTSGDSIRRIWEALYGIDGMSVHTAEGAIPGAKPPKALPTFHSDGRIEAPIRRADAREPRRRAKAT